MRRRHVAILAGLGLVLVVGCGLGLRGGDGAREGRVASAATPSAGVITSAATTPPVPRARTTPPVPPGRDARLLLPRLHVAARMERVDLHGRVMQIPRDPRVVGWWRAGAVPGADHGSAVIVGHVNYGGTAGAFARLGRTRPGDGVTLTEPRLRFRVVAIRSYAKSDGIPAAAFARGGPPRLVLITCGGDFDPHTGNYEDNVVVYAVPSG